MLFKDDIDISWPRSLALEQDKFAVDTQDTTIKWVKAIITYDGRKVYDAIKRTEALTSIILYSQLGKYRWKWIEHSSTIDIVEKIGIQNAEVLAYSSDNVKHVPIKWYKHRLLSVAHRLRKKNPNIANDFYDAHSTITPLKKEMTYVPSLLLFYLKQWFTIDKIHISNHTDASRPFFPSYDINDKQKALVYQIIDDFLRKGDVALPFFVELRPMIEDDTPIVPQSDISTQKYFSEIADIITSDLGWQAGYSLLGDKNLREMEAVLELPKWKY